MQTHANSHMHRNDNWHALLHSHMYIICMHARTHWHIAKGTLHYEYMYNTLIARLKEISCRWSSLVDIFLFVSVTMSLGHTMCHAYYLQWNNSQDLFFWFVLYTEQFLMTQSGHGIVCRLGGRTHKAHVPCFVVKHPGHRRKLCIHHPFWQFIMSQQLSNIAK